MSGHSMATSRTAFSIAFSRSAGTFELSNNVSLPFHRELSVVNRDQLHLHVATVNVGHGETLLPVTHALLKVVGVLHIHEVPDLDTGEDLPNLLTQTQRVTVLGQPVRVPHDDGHTELLSRVQRRHATDLRQPDTAQMTVGDNPVRGDLVPVRGLLDPEPVEIQQLRE